MVEYFLCSRSTTIGVVPVAKIYDVMMHNPSIEDGCVAHLSVNGLLSIIAASFNTVQHRSEVVDTQLERTRRLVEDQISLLRYIILDFAYMAESNKPFLT